MSKCDLSIELDQSHPFHWSGEAIVGTVSLRANEEINCRALTLHCNWRTHGKGNVNSGDGSKVTLHSGIIAAGQTLRLPFEVFAFSWPPTYHGYQFSIEHSLVANIDIPWAFDPKTSVPIHVLPRPRADDELPKISQGGVFGPLFIWGFAFLALSVFATVASSAAGFPVLISWLILAGLMFAGWGWFSWLPTWIVGDVQYKLDTQHLQAGETLNGVISLCPRRPLTIQGIFVELVAEESCVSGSGSNRKTYNHALHKQTYPVVQETSLRAGETRQLEFSIQLPPIAAYSIDESSNKLRWNASVRIGLAGLPDWRKHLSLWVIPPHDPNRLVQLQPAYVPDNGRSAAGQTAAGQMNRLSLPPLPPPGEPMGSEPLLGEPIDQFADDLDITLGETASHLWALQGKPAELSQVAAAMVGLPLEISVQVDRRWLSGGTESQWLHGDETLIWGVYPDPPLPLALAVPRSLADEVAAAESTVWQGEGEIVGWDTAGQRLRLRVYP